MYGTTSFTLSQKPLFMSFQESQNQKLFTCPFFILTQFVFAMLCSVTIFKHNMNERQREIVKSMHIKTFEQFMKTELVSPVEWRTWLEISTVQSSVNCFENRAGVCSHCAGQQLGQDADRAGLSQWPLPQFSSKLHNNTSTQAPQQAP